MESNHPSGISRTVDILVVEDSPTQAEQLKYQLEAHNYNIVITSNGILALDYLQNADPILIITDICMPEMDGYELCRRIRKQKRSGEIPVILLTSLSNTEDVLEGLECGADYFISKPYDKNYLLMIVNQLVNSHKSVKPKTIWTDIEVTFGGKQRVIKANHQQMLTLLISTYETAIIKNKELLRIQEELQELNDQLEEIVEERTLEVKLNERKFLDLYNNAPSMFMSVQFPENTIIECNDTLVRKTGFERSEIIGSNISVIYHQDCMEDLKRSTEIFNDCGEINNIELALQTKSGGKIPVLINSSSLRDEEGTILNSRTVLNDISELKQAREELVKAKEKAEESDKLKSAFLANMSHEIRTPMNGILGFSQLLKDPDFSEEEKGSYIDIIDSSTNQLLHIITDILNISKIEAGQETPKLSVINLKKLMEEVNCFFLPQAQLHGLKWNMNVDVPTANLNIKSDLIKLRHILDNIIANALKFTETGFIDIKVSLQNESLIFKVKDSGIGIDASQHQVIFDRFRQVELTHSRKYGGTGLGLSLAKSYVSMLGGNISVESELGKGSTFTIEIPYLPGEDQKTGIESHHKDVTVFNDWKAYTILLAEDEEANLFYLETVLRNSGIQILTAMNGVEAVECCRNNSSISLVLMDVKMPEMDGLTAAKIIKSFRSNLPIIATTAYALSSDRDRCLEAGCNEYLPKPIKRENLLDMIGSFLN